MIIAFLLANITSITYWYYVEVPHYGSRWDECEAYGDKETFAYLKCLDKYGIGAIEQDHRKLYLIDHLIGTLIVFNILIFFLPSFFYVFLYRGIIKDELPY